MEHPWGKEIKTVQIKSLELCMAPPQELRLLHSNTRGVQKVLQIDIEKIHKALQFDFI